MNKICKGCAKWKAFKKKCHYYWPGKKVCTKYGIHDEFKQEEDEIRRMIDNYWKVKRRLEGWL